MKDKKEKTTRVESSVSSKSGKTEKLRAIEDAISSIEKAFGKGSIMRLSEGPVEAIEVIPSGSLALDYALNIGGFPRGRVIEIYGPEMSGKTTLCLHTIAEAQKTGGLAAFVDAEHALDATYAKRLGVKVEDLLISQPDCGEQALEIVDTLVRSNALDLIVIDSVAALVPRAELEGEMGDSHMAVQARLMSQALRKLTGIISKSKTSVIFINQLRSKIGIMFGNPETTAGGNALKFYASVRIDIRRIASLKVDDQVVGNRTKIKIVKSKVSPPFREVEVDIVYGQGINKYAEVVDLGIAFNIIQKSGAWLTIGEDRIQGREKLIQAFAEDGVFFETIRREVAEGLNANLSHYKNIKSYYYGKDTCYKRYNRGSE